MAQVFSVQDWQLFYGFITLIVTIAGTTFAIARFVYTLKGDLRIMEQQLKQYKSELHKQEMQTSSILKIYQDIGIENIKKSVRGGT